MDVKVVVVARFPLVGCLVVETTLYKGQAVVIEHAWR